MSEKCQLCPLHKESKVNLLRGVGPQPASILCIGEGPGEQEEIHNSPFVGPAGQLFDQLLIKAGIDRNSIRICNTVCCRPVDKEKSWTDRRGHVHYGNRQPTLEEIYTCAPTYLEQEIKNTKPNVIVPVGAIALKYLSGEFSVEGYDQKDGMFVPKLVQNGKKCPGINKERGIERWSEKYNCKILPIIHPSALLRGSRLLNTTVEDLKRVRIASETKEIVKAPEGQYVICDTWDLVEWALERIQAVPEFSIDIETNDLDWQRSQINYIGFSWKEGTGVSIPMVREDGKQQWSAQQEAHIYTTIDKVYANPKICKVGHNHLKFDQHFLHNYGVRYPINVYDTMLAHSMLDSDSAHGLKELTWTYFSGMGGYEKEYDEAEALAKKEGRKRHTMPKKLVAIYNGKDADLTLRLKHILQEQMKNFPPEKFFNTWIPEIAECAWDTERAGIAIDFEMLKDMYNRMSKHKHQVIEQFNGQIYAERVDDSDDPSKVEKPNINLGSTKQLCKIFFEEKKMSVIKEGKSGPSLDKGVILELRQKYPEDKALGMVIDYRKLDKKIGTYLEGHKNAALFGKSEISDKVKSLYWDMESARKDGFYSDGKIHCNYNLHVANTGRLSSTDPNLQAIPRVTEDDKKRGYAIRNYFVADAGCKLVSADLSQAEMWCMFAMSKDAALKAALESTKGIHYSFASTLFGVPIEEVTDAQKNISKTTNFSILYGVTAESLAQRLHVSVEEGERYIRGFHSAYPAVSWYLQETVEFVRKNKYAVSAFGRVRHFPAIDSPHKPTREAAERECQNFVIQSPTSDVAQIAAVKIMRFIRNNKLKSRRVLTTHDDNGYNVPEEELNTMTKTIKSNMEDYVPELGITMKCEIEISERWKLEDEEDSVNLEEELV